MFQVIAFDADDTLWENEAYYTGAKQKFASLLSAYETPESILHRLDAKEIANIAHLGYGIKSFILSMIETALEVSAGQAPGEVFQGILGLMHAMLAEEVELFPQVVETLAALSKDYPLMLITKGDGVEQERKIARSGIGGYFRYVEVVGEKNETSYRLILDKYRLAPEGFLMIGNSLRSDILPVINLGGLAIYIPQAHTWAHETNVETTPAPGKFFELPHLGELPDLIHKLAVRG
jgi:putative hydrolase of the HAD superfamily